MTAVALDHVNLRTTRLAEMCAFYCDVLGMRVGPRPAFGFGGAWLYAGDQAVVHLVEVDAPPDRVGRLALEHFAVRGKDLAAFDAMLRARSLSRRIAIVRDFGIYQINLTDPDGNRVHVDFPLADAEALGLVGPNAG